MVLSIVFYGIVDFPTFIYALYRTPIQAFSGIPTRDESETPSPEPSGAVFAGKLTTCYEHSSGAVCCISSCHLCALYFMLLLVDADDGSGDFMCIPACYVYFELR